MEDYISDIEVIAKNGLPDMVKVSDIIKPKLITGKDTDQLWDSLHSMRTYGVRRMPIVDKKGNLVGIITTDDILELFTEELQDMAQLSAFEQKKEKITG